MKAIPIGLALLAALAVASGCSRDIGDECSTSVDCDPNGTRACDLSQPGGYCTIQGCTETSCPSSSSCIRLFPVQYLTMQCHPACEDIPPCRTGDCGEPDPKNCLPVCPTGCTGPEDLCTPDELCLDTGLCARRSLEQRYCAKDCSSNGDCRSGYECRTTGGADGSMGLSSLPNVTARFCAPAIH